jgi:hypothetical protein
MLKISSNKKTRQNGGPWYALRGKCRKPNRFVMDLALFSLTAFLFGFVCGYGLRAWISRRRRRRSRQRIRSDLKYK